MIFGKLKENLGVSHIDPTLWRMLVIDSDFTGKNRQK